MEILIKIKKQLLVKIVAAVSVLIFLDAFFVLRPTFGNKITRVSYIAENKTFITRVYVNLEIHTKDGFELKDANVTVRLKTEDGTFEDTFDTEHYKARREFTGAYSYIELEARVNSYHVTGYAKYVIPAVIMFLISGAGMTYCIYYWTHNRKNSNNGEQ